MTRVRTYRELPPIVTGYPLDDVWSVVVPVARTNLVTNPSFETNTTSWTAIGGSIASSTAQQYHGAYSLAITPSAATTDGARYDTVSLTSGTIYAYSAKVRGVGGLKYKLCLETTGAVELTSVTFVANGRWQWIVGYYVETSSTTRRVTARKASHASTAVFYIDGVQVEAIAAGETASTYIDGDQRGLIPNQFPLPYLWNGTPHASTSSRAGQTRAGGMIVKFTRYNFLLTAMIGLGLAVPQNAVTEYARIDGGFDNYTRKPTRQFTLTGMLQGKTYQQLRDNRSGLAQLLDRDQVAQDQMLVLRHHLEDVNGNALSNEVIIAAKYQSGLDGSTDNQAAQTTPITFTQYFPFVLSEGESGASLTVQTTVGTVNRIAQRSPAGVWSTLGTGMNNIVANLARGKNGRLYAVGTFTTAGGSAVKKVAAWDGTTWNVIDAGITSVTGPLRAIAVGPDGKIYIGGPGIVIGGVTGSVASYDPSTTTWALVGGANNTDVVYSLAIDATGNIYAGGTNSGGTNNSVQKWNGAAWSSLSLTDGAGSIVYALAIARDGSTLYAGGSFASIGANAITRLAKYSGTGTTWLAVGSPAAAPNNDVTSIAFGLNGLMYVGGQYTAIGGLTTTGIAVFNGVAWTALGSGVNNGANSLAVSPDGTIYTRGLFTSANGYVTPGGVARWNGATWTSIDASLPVNAGVFGALLLDVDGTLTVGLDATGSATAAGITTITNPGTARAYPIITINGPSSGTARIYSIINYTTGRAIYLNLTLNVGEVATLRFKPDQLSFISDFQGNIASKILPGSSQADFFLQPGANTLAFFSASSTVVATLNYRPAFASLDDVP